MLRSQSSHTGPGDRIGPTEEGNLGFESAVERRAQASADGHSTNSLSVRALDGNLSKPIDSTPARYSRGEYRWRLEGYEGKQIDAARAEGQVGPRCPLLARCYSTVDLFI